MHCCLSCACFPLATWLLVLAMSRLQSGCYGGDVRLGGFVWPAWASPPSCFSDFPRGLGINCFACVFLLLCLIHCCLLVSGNEALRPAYIVLFPWFQAVLRTLINQGGTTSRIALDEGFPLLISGQSIMAPFLRRTTDTFHKVRSLSCHSLCSLVIFFAALTLAHVVCLGRVVVALGLAVGVCFFEFPSQWSCSWGFQRHPFFGRSVSQVFEWEKGPLATEGASTVPESLNQVPLSVADTPAASPVFIHMSLFPGPFLFPPPALAASVLPRCLTTLPAASLAPRLLAVVAAALLFMLPLSALRISPRDLPHPGFSARSHRARTMLTPLMVGSRSTPCGPPNIEAYLSGQLMGDVPKDWLRSQGFGTCEVCQRILSLGFNGRCPSCFHAMTSSRGRPSSD